MADKFITKIRTDEGDLQIDYTALANLPKSDTNLKNPGGFADAYEVGTRLGELEKDVEDLSKNSVKSSTTINNKSLANNITLEPSDIKAAPENHEHVASDITSGEISMGQGGTGAKNGKDGLKNLLADGYMLLSGYQYGNSVPPVPEKQEDKEAMTGRIFFVKVQQ